MGAISVDDGEEGLNSLRKITASVKSTLGRRQISSSASFNVDLARWASALLVLVYHVRVNVFSQYILPKSDAYAPLARIVDVVTGLGPAAVLWFFVLSGFLVGGGVLHKVSMGTFCYREYFYQRALRLYVVLLPALVLGALLDLSRIHLVGMSVGGANLPPPARLRNAYLIPSHDVCGKFVVPSNNCGSNIWK